jgi:hypothetical protein
MNKHSSTASTAAARCRRKTWRISSPALGHERTRKEDSDMTIASRVEEASALCLSRDARLVGIRWDAVAWGIVLDLDSPVSEAAKAPMRRVWLVFRGIDEVTIPLRGTRLPTGIWLTSPFGAEDAEGGFRSFTCWALLPTFDGNVLRPARTPGKISLRAQELVGVVSTRAETPTDYGLTWESRTGLATDQDMWAIANGQ